MSDSTITRRNALKAGAAMVAAPLAGAAVAKAATPKAPAVGVSTLGFREYTNEELAKVLAAENIKMVQLFLSQKDSNYWKFNGRNDVSSMTPDRCKAIAKAYRSRGIEIHSIGVYTNLIHPDEAECTANLAYFEDMMKIGAAMDVRTFINEAGHYEPEESKSSTPYFLRGEVWPHMVSMGKRLGALADKYDATVLLEPYFGSFYTSAKRTRVFIEEIGSPRIRALLDPANLLEINDLEEMFAQLHPYIDCLHAKDRKLHVDRGVAAGQGDLDYNKFVALAAKYTPHAPLIAEYVGSKDYKQALDIVYKAIANQGKV